MKTPYVYKSMDGDINKLFKNVIYYPKSRLSDDIWREISVKQARQLKIQSQIYTFVGILSLACFVFSVITFKNQITKSGFFEYVSIAFSGNGMFAHYWKEYLLSLADSLPVASLGASLFLFASMLVSVRKVINHYRFRLLKVS